MCSHLNIVYISSSQTFLGCHSFSAQALLADLHHQHGYPWPSPTTRLNHSSLPVGLQDYILYRHRTVVYRLSCLCLSIWRGPLEYVTYEVVSTSPAVSRIFDLSWIVFVMSGRWPYSCWSVGCCLQDLSTNACSILV